MLTFVCEDDWFPVGIAHLCRMGELRKENQMAIEFTKPLEEYGIGRAGPVKWWFDPNSTSTRGPVRANEAGWQEKRWPKQIVMLAKRRGMLRSRLGRDCFLIGPCSEWREEQKSNVGRPGRGERARVF
jgi:hypothetical protein